MLVPGIRVGVVAVPIEFVRRLDGLVYRFRRDGTFNGRPSFKRLDLELWCRWLPERG
ncbi:hypothetical protein ACFZB9_06910 [Kitasatospora sp. NPDC008050]|uniref:hypothetical protein n=1 Tax=Kitasatospora sp. NPDC008050 TaxID=3364021 RepID=UPI0036E04B66